MKTLLAGILSLCFALGLVSCSGGLEPYPIPPDFTGFRGTVRFVGDSTAWPTDSIYNLVVVAFEEQPDSVTDILPAVLGGRAVFSTSLPLFVDSATYEIELPADRERTFRYVVVGMQDGPVITQDWTMIAVHAIDNDPTRPDSVTIAPGVTSVVDFTVDFKNLPPQPFD